MCKSPKEKKKSCALCRGSLTFHGSQTLDGRTSFRPLALTLTPPPRIPASLRKVACVQQQQLGVCGCVCQVVWTHLCWGRRRSRAAPAGCCRRSWRCSRTWGRRRRSPSPAAPTCLWTQHSDTMALGQAVLSIQPRNQSESLITSVNTTCWLMPDIVSTRSTATICTDILSHYLCSLLCLSVLNDAYFCEFW